MLLCPNEEDIVENPRYQELIDYRMILGPLIETGKVSLSVPMKIAISSGDMSMAGHILLRSSKHPSTGMLDWHDLDMAYIDTDWLDLPSAVGKLWFIGLSSNRLPSVPMEILNFPNLVKLQLRNNKITDLPSELLTMPKLKHLDVSFNRISSLPEVLLQHTISECLIELNLSNNMLAALPDYFRYSTLQNLDISCNKLQTVPVCILHMRRLHTLCLSGNIGLQQIPYELGMLRNLSLLSLDDLPYACNLPSRDKTSPLEFLKQRARGLQHVSHYDVMLIGFLKYPNLLELIHKATVKESKRKAFSLLTFKSARQFLHFQHVFALPSSVYLIVWDCQQGQDANDLLAVLVHLSIHAPDAAVVVSACWSTAVTPVTEASVRQQVNSSNWSDLSGKIKVVSTCVEKEALVSRVHSIGGLFSTLEREAEKNTITTSIPSSYFFLTDIVKREAGKCLNDGKAPLISKWDFWEVVRSSPQNDLVGHKELSMVVSFLSITGSILQLSSNRSDTVDYFALDRQFFLDLVSPLLAGPKGTMRSESGFILPTFLVDLFDSPLLQNPLPYPLHIFASQHGLAISITSTKSLVSSMLRSRNTGFLSSSEFSSQYHIRRIITFRLTPSSFWGKLIAHLLINMSQLISSSGVVAANHGLTNQLESIPGEDLANWSYWKSGIIVWTGGDLVVSVESIPPITKPKYREGLEMRVANTPMGVRAINLVTATVNSLLINWYPKVWETVEFSVRCPGCSNSTASQPTLFPCIECCRAFCHSISLQCCKHNSSFLPTDLVPDLLQPGGCEQSICLRTLFIDPACLDVKVQEKSACLSQAPSETVFRGTFNKIDIAVKIFPPPAANPSRTNSAIDPYLNFFHEFSILNHLTNTVACPFIVNMIVASCDPLSLVFPYASYGSLEEVILESHIAFPPLLRVRILLQLSIGLEALHGARIIHRHICLANILVFSLSIDDSVNIKLAGFSEACIGVQQGLGKRMCGAFPAPEMCQEKCEYDERVDTFAFAFTAYEILTRKKLHSWQGVPFQIASINDKRPSLVPISTIAPHFAPLLQKCWEKDLSKRPFLVEIVEYFQDPLHTVIRSGRCVNKSHEIYSTAVHFSKDKKGALKRDIYFCSGVLSKDDSALLMHLTYPSLEVKESTSLPSRFVICMCCTHDQLWVSFQQRFVRVYSASTLEYICEIKLSYHTLAMTATPSSIYLGLENGEVHAFKLSFTTTSGEAFISRNICSGKPVKALETLDYSILCVSKSLCYRIHPNTLEIEQQILTVSETEVKCAVMARDRTNDLEFLWVGFRRSQQVVVFNGEDGKALYGVNCCEVLGMERLEVWVQTMCVVLDTVWVGLNTGHILIFSAFSPTPLLQTHFSVHVGNVRQLLLLHPGYTGSISSFMPDSSYSDLSRKRSLSVLQFLPPSPKYLPVLSCGQGIKKAPPVITTDGIVDNENCQSSETGLFAVILEGLDKIRTEELEIHSKRRPMPYMEGHRQRHPQYLYEEDTSISQPVFPLPMETMTQAKPVRHRNTQERPPARSFARDPSQDPDMVGWEIVTSSDALTAPSKTPNVAELGRSSTAPSSTTSILAKLRKKPKKSLSPVPSKEATVSPPEKKDVKQNGGPLRTSLSVSPEMDDSGDDSDCPYIKMSSAPPVRPRVHTVGAVGGYPTTPVRSPFRPMEELIVTSR